MINKSISLKLGSWDLGSWVFSPGLYSTLITLLLFPLFVYLGFWQYHRMEEKQLFISQMESRPSLPPLEIQDLKNLKTIKNLNNMNDSDEINTQKKEALKFRIIKIRGQFLNSHQILLDNQILNGQVGYNIITPFLVEPSLRGEAEAIQILLINRGWIPLGENRSKIPEIKAIEGMVSLTGMINYPPRPLLLANQSIELKAPGQPYLAQLIDFNEISKLFSEPLLPIIVNLQEPETYGYELKKISQLNNIGISPNKHLGYAVQWFTISVISLIYYLVINIKRRS